MDQMTEHTEELRRLASTGDGSAIDQLVDAGLVGNPDGETVQGELTTQAEIRKAIADHRKVLDAYERRGGRLSGEQRADMRRGRARLEALTARYEGMME